MISLKLPDGSVKQVPIGTRPRQVAEGIGKRLAQVAIAAKVNGQIVDLDREIAPPADAGGSPVEFAILREQDRDALDVLRHSCAHVMARAVMRLFPGTQLAFGPAIENRFYYDIDSPTPIKEEDFPRIEAEMKKIVAAAEPFERFERSIPDGRQLVADLGQALKVEHIDEELSKFPSVSFYRQGEFIDLCRGPHIPHAGRIGAFKLLSIAGAYWKNDANRKQLQRLYGTAFFSQKDLDAYLTEVEEAKKRDHRVLGKQLKLFTISQQAGQGIILWMPKGAVVRGLLEAFIKEELLKRGYQPVYTPHIGNLEMYRRSGHFPKYRDAQFPPIYFNPIGGAIDLAEYRFSLGTEWYQKSETPAEWDEQKEQSFQNLLGQIQFTIPGYRAAKTDADRLDVLDKSVRQLLQGAGIQLPEYEAAKTPQERGNALRSWLEEQEGYLLKPMNCPHHIQIYKATPRSYRDLPIKLAEFGTVYRYEQSGELNGMTRVRGFTQDDAHLFVTPEQVEAELRSEIDLVQFVLKSLNLSNYRVRISVSGPNREKYVGAPDLWENAEQTLIRVAKDVGLNYSIGVGEAAFYGPKIDYIVRDCIGREWQLGTIQLDYNLPNRFDLEYTGADNKPHRPVMLHRAPFGSMERFCGILIEHFAGAFPLWLAPEQVRVLTISEKFTDYGKQVEAKLREAGFRVTGDWRSEKVNAKIREAQLEKIPYMLVVGEKEATAGTVAVRDRVAGDLGALPVPEVIYQLAEEVREKRIREVSQATAAVGDGAAKFAG
ncbi:MAG: threonine--tRNA ligase [Gemmataceae bacterium]